MKVLAKEFRRLTGNHHTSAAATSEQKQFLLSPGVNAVAVPIYHPPYLPIREPACTRSAAASSSSVSPEQCCSEEVLLGVASRPVCVLAVRECVRVA